MHKTQVLEFFGTQKAVAEAVGVSQPAVSKWPDIVPELQAMKLERVTGGRLRYDPALYPKSRSARVA